MSRTRLFPKSPGGIAPFLAALLLFLAGAAPADARTCLWDGGGGDGLWSTASNWDGGNDDPDGGDTVVLDHSLVGGAYTVNITSAVAGGNVDLNGLQIHPEAAAQAGGNIILNAQSGMDDDIKIDNGGNTTQLEVKTDAVGGFTGTFNYAAAGRKLKLRGTGATNGLYCNGGTFSMTAGTLETAGDLDINCTTLGSAPKLASVTVKNGDTLKTVLVVGGANLAIAGSVVASGTFELSDVNNPTVTITGDYDGGGSTGLSFGSSGATGTGRLEIKGANVTFPVEANFNEEQGTVIFGGTSTQTMPARQYFNVEINKVDATDVLVVRPGDSTIRVSQITGSTSPIQEDITTAVGFYAAGARVGDNKAPAPDTYLVKVTATGTPTVEVNGTSDSTGITFDGVTWSLDVAGTGLDFVFKVGPAVNDQVNVIVTAAATSVDTQISGDTSPSERDNNFGNTTVLNVAGTLASGTDDDTDRALFYFDVSELPLNANISYAAVNLYFDNAQFAATAIPLRMYQVMKDWTLGGTSDGSKNNGAGIDDEPTWNHARRVETAWDTAGCQSSPGDRGTNPINSRNVPGNAVDDDVFYRWYNAIDDEAAGGMTDLRTLVSGWRNGTAANYGVIFVKNNSGNAERRWRSGNYAAATSTTRPFLDCKYTLDKSLIVVTLGGQALIAGRLDVINGTLDLGTQTLFLNNAAATTSFVRSGGTLKMTGTTAARPTLKIDDADTSIEINGKLQTSIDPSKISDSTKWPLITRTVAGDGAPYFTNGTALYDFKIKGPGTADINGLLFEYSNGSGLQIGDGATDPTVTQLQNVTLQNFPAGATQAVYIQTAALNLACPNITFSLVASQTNVKLVDRSGLTSDVNMTLQDRTGLAEGLDDDADADADGDSSDAGSTPVGGSVVQWVYTLNNTMPGTGQSYPMAAIDFSTFNFYAGYYIASGVNAAGDDRLYRLNTDGDNVSYGADPDEGNRYFTISGHGHIVGPVWWETSGGKHWIYFGTDAGYIYILEDKSTTPRLSNQAGLGSPIRLANIVQVTTPVISDMTNLYFGAKDNIGAGSFFVKAIDLASGLEYSSPGTPLTTVAARSAISMDYTRSASPYLYVGGDAVAGKGHVMQINVSTMAMLNDKNNPPTDHVRGITTLVPIWATTYANLWVGSNDNSMYCFTGSGQLGGQVACTVAGTAAGWPIATTGDVTGWTYYQYLRGHVVFGNGNGDLYAKTVAGAEAFGVGASPLTLDGATPLPDRAINSGPIVVVTNAGQNDEVVYVGNDNGKVFAVDVSNRQVIRTWTFGSGVKISTIARDYNTHRILVGLGKENGTDVTKRVGWMVELDPVTDPTP